MKILLRLHGLVATWALLRQSYEVLLIVELQEKPKEHQSLGRETFQKTEKKVEQKVPQVLVITMATVKK